MADAIVLAEHEAHGHTDDSEVTVAPGNLDETGRFLPPAQLRARFAALSVGKPFVTSCGSGVVACHNALAMRQAGLPDPILYAGSYSDWTRSGEPVATGPEPGKVPAE